MGEERKAVTPVTEAERHASLDALRGFALLGILTMNVIAGLPAATYMNAPLSGGFTGWNYAAWLVGYLVFNEKMMSIFSMLFGAGLILISDRATVRGRSPVGYFLRRTAALLLFGLLHAYFLFYGDILYTYAMCSLLVFWARNWSPPALLSAGVAMLLPGIAFTLLFGAFFRYAENASARVDAARAAGQAPRHSDVEVAKSWDEAKKDFHPSPEKVAEEVRRHREGTYWENTRKRIEESLGMQTFIFASMLVWSVGGRMLIGMALMKLGVWTGERSSRFYRLMVLLGYGLGFPLVAAGAYYQQKHGFEMAHLFLGDMMWNEFGSILVALGHTGVVMMLWKAGAFPRVFALLAAVGRMAFTNYLMQSLIMLLFFDTFGMFDRLDRVGLSVFVVAVWAFQLAVSPLCLRYFRFGPAEWLWRSLTYWRWQPVLA